MVIIVVLVTMVAVMAQQKTGVDSSSGLFNNGQSKILKDSTDKKENLVLKSKVEALAEVLKKHFDNFIACEKHNKVELVFLVDASSSVGAENFQSELQFVKKLLADFSVSFNATRVALVSFSSIGQVVREVDMLSQPSADYDKCSILHHHIKYTGGGTYTLGAMQEAQDIFSHSRHDSRKALFLVTDGFSNGGDPRNLAKVLKSDGVTIFTFGVHNGNTAELFEMASIPGEEYSYTLDSFEEFVALARRALHRDLAAGVYRPVSNIGLCDTPCSPMAECACGLRTGQYECLCLPGYYGLGTTDQEYPCLACPNGTYHDGSVPGDVTMCTPCPDVNHMTLQPAVGLQDCVCKRGFIANGPACDMVKCPMLKAPKNGLFVRGPCNNVVNAGCGLRCKVGYALVGSSVRLCQQNGQWSGKTPKCIVKRCPRLQPPSNGIVACSPKVSSDEDFPVDAECRFSCHSGSHLVGSPVRTCLPLARWDGLPATCKPIKCLALPKVPNGVWHPEECMTSRKLPFEQNCTLICNNGFEREGPAVRKCVLKGSWTQKEELSKCLDTKPPVLTCPDNMTVSADPGASFATVNWTVPEPEDNSNQSVLLWSDPSSDLPMKLPIGMTYISYVATDSSYNQAVCEFYINITDNEPPAVEYCESPLPIYITGDTRQIINWTKPQFSDNSMKEVHVNVSHILDDLPIGTTEVNFTAFDESGNSNICAMNFSIIDNGCKDLTSSVIANCSNNVCSLSCEEGFMFTSGNLTIEVPYPCEPSMIPECSETEEPNYIIQEGSFLLTPTSPDLCNDSTFLNQVKVSVKESLVEVCENATDDCTLGVESKCEDIIESAEEQSNQIFSRRKRSMSERSIKVDFKLTGKYNERSQDKLSSWSKNRTHLKNIPKKRISRVTLKPFKINCSPGTTLRRNRCVKCPPGTFWEAESGNCVACGYGTYQPLSSQKRCLLCPNNTSTRKMHAKHIHACRDICPAGTYGNNRGQGAGWVSVKPCISCPVGWYQPLKGAQSCLQCPNNLTTSHRKTVHVTDCHAYPPKCQPTSCLNGGTCLVVSGFLTCICPNGFIGGRCEHVKNECQSLPCLHGGSCTDTEEGYTCSCPAGFTGKDCQVDIDECESNPCLNDGECTDLVDSYVCHCKPAFEGDRCEVNVDDCSPGPCAGGSSCVDLVANYSCVCRPGYSGRNCELDPCLTPDLCQNNGVCYFSDNTTQPSYWCECEPGFTGPHCETEIDLCESSPCQHNATCVNQPLTLQFQCVCKHGYSGQYCETYLPSNFTLFFPTSGTSSYVKLKGPHSTMNEITVCFWVRTKDNLNYGTIFSYATYTHDNSLTLTDYNGLVIYVNGDRVVTDVTANDGVWHHVCVEWASVGGQWRIYKDGTLRDSGIGLANNTSILGGGVLVLGQDQDRIGGGFNAAESLVGYLTNVNLWNYNLGLEKLHQLATVCDGQEEGSVLSWGQFRLGIHGKVKIENGILCQGCKSLSVPPNTHIALSEDNDTATYTCDPGYSIKFFGAYEVSKVERKCLIHGEWEGKTPTCTRRSCGFPGYFPAGWIIGRSYLYQSQIEYVCQLGYRLVGSNIRTCLVDGTWSGEVPSCQGGDCPDVTTPENGMMWGSHDTYYRLEFECKSGYELHGMDTITCLVNKTWSHDPPQCLPITCSYHSNTSTSVLLSGQSEVTQDRYPLNSYVKIVCKEGYKSNVSPYNMTCTCMGWSPPPTDLDCVQITCPDLDIENGSIVAESLTYGNVINVMCDKGFKLNGSAELTCLSSGDWNSSSSCQKVTCPEISTIHLSLPQSEYGKVATIQCPPGMLLLARGHFVKEQEIRWECSEDGEWRNLTEAPVDPNVLSCVSKPPTICSRPEGPQFGYIVPDVDNASSYSIGHKLQVQCRQGYLLEGLNFTTCKQNGSWSNETVCRAVDCGPPPQPPLTRLALVSSTLYGSLVKLRCDEGYQVYGDLSLRCQTNKKWSRPRGRCIRISCGKPLLEEGMSFIGNAYLFQEKLKIICPTGFAVNGSDTITCEKNGKWNSTPSCIRL